METGKPETASREAGTSGTGETGETGVTGVTGETGETEGIDVSLIKSGIVAETPIPAVVSSLMSRKSAGTLSALRMWDRSGSGAGAWATEKRRTVGPAGTAGIGGGSWAQAPRIRSSREKPLLLRNRGEFPTSVWPG